VWVGVGGARPAARSDLDCLSVGAWSGAWLVQVGEEVEFRLLRRPRNSIIPEVADAGAGDRAAHAPPGGVSGAAVAADFERAWHSGTAAHPSGAAGGPPPAAPNRFAKFSTVADPMPLWRQAAQELAGYAAQVPHITLTVSLGPVALCWTRCRIILLTGRRMLR
jgi:hypothetical protein